MTIYKKIVSKIDEEDWNIAIASSKLHLLKKLRSSFPKRNIWILTTINKQNEQNYRDRKTYTLIISKRYVSKIRKEDWKKVIVF